MKSRLSQRLITETGGLLILCGLFPFWETSRAIHVVTALFALIYLLKVKPGLYRDQKLFAFPIYLFIAASGDLRLRGFFW